jgi:hypothetical protein
MLALIGTLGCLQVSEDTDGRWAPLDAACVPIGDPRVVLDAYDAVLYAPAGDTLAFSINDEISQIPLRGGEPRVVVRGNGLYQFGVIGNQLVYYESNGDLDNRSPIDVIVDHGVERDPQRSMPRYERISPAPGAIVSDLRVLDTGIYFTTAVAAPQQPLGQWRWDPRTRQSAAFALNAGSLVVNDGVSFFYFTPQSELMIRPVLPGPLRTFIAKDPDLSYRPIGIDGDEVVFVELDVLNGSSQLVIRAADGSERSLASGPQINSATLDARYVYFNDDRARTTLYRVPRAGGEIEPYFVGEPNSLVFQITKDACNLYWQQLTIDGSRVHAASL